MGKLTVNSGWRPTSGAGGAEGPLPHGPSFAGHVLRLQLQAGLLF